MGAHDLEKDLKRLACELSYGSYLAVHNSLKSLSPSETGLPELRLAILSNFVVAPLVPVLCGEIALAGFHPLVYEGTYDAFVQEALDPSGPLYGFHPDFVLLALWLEKLSPALCNRFLALMGDAAAQEAQRVLSVVGETIEALRRHTNTPVLANNFPIPAYTTLGILDGQSEASQTQTILGINRDLLHCLQNWRDVYLVDFSSVIARLGSHQAVDERFWQMNQAPLSRHALLPLGREYAKFVRALRGKARKCLVLDCDNTLWGGIVGESGLSGLQLGTTYPGSCYRALQEEVLNLHDRGVILALCSKNNEADVMEVFRNHPDMLLRENHLASWRINWDDKVSNLRKLAAELNIGLDSMVLVDDSDFECGLVRMQLPEVTVLQLKGEPHSYRSLLMSHGYFDTLTLSAEDRMRNRTYRENLLRNELQSASHSIEDYLSKLSLVAEIGDADPVTIPRIAQLTQKTNQFNLTTRRYTEGDIRAFAGDPNVDVFWMRVRDRISDLGIVGVAIVKYSGDDAEIDSFLMSCRALGRRVEEVLLVHVLNRSAVRGCRRVSGRYLVSQRNSQVSDFYARLGFGLKAGDENGIEWEIAIDKAGLKAPEWIGVIMIGRESRDAVS